MRRFYFFFTLLLLAFNISIGQSIKITCSEKQRKNDNGKDPIITTTCYIKNFKFKETAYPDYAGRYFHTEYEVYVLVNKKYSKTVNSEVFNKNQGKLVALINERIQQDFKSFLSDSAVKDCLTGLDSIPVYKMNDFEISFHSNEIWFEVHWGLVSACRSVDGTIVSFKLPEIEKYLK